MVKWWRLSILGLLGTLLLPLAAGAEQLTLEECLERSAFFSPTLQVAQHDRQVAAEDTVLARSGSLPRLDFQAGYVLQAAPQAVKFGPNVQETQQADFAFANLGVYQVLYDFGRTDSRLRQAAMRQDAIANSYRALEQDEFLRVVRGYFAILLGEKLLQTAKDEVRQREQHLQVAQTLFEEGVTTRNDLLQAEVKLAGSRQKQLAIASAITNGWLQLNYLTGKPGEYRADLSELTGPSPTTSFMSQRAGLLERQEILAQRAVIRSREAGVEESRTGFYPEFFLKLGVDYTQNDRVVEQAIWSATLGFKVNLFDGHATSARQRQAVKLLAQEKERLQSMEAGIRLELQTARNDLTVASERISVTETAIKQSQENLRINTDRYQAQVGTATEVIDAQTLLSQARSDYYQALFDYQVALARVKRAAGEL